MADLNTPSDGTLTAKEVSRLDALRDELMALANTRATEILGEGDRAASGREAALCMAYVETIASAYRGSPIAGIIATMLGNGIAAEIARRITEPAGRPLQ